MGTTRVGEQELVGAGPFTLTVPADTSLAVVSYGWYAAEGDDCTAMTIGGVSMTKRGGYAAISLVRPTVGVFELASPPTGSQSLALTITSNASSSRVHVHYYKGTNGIRDVATGQMSGNYGTPATIYTDTFDVIAGDLCLSEAWAYTDGSFTGGGQTLVDSYTSGSTTALCEKTASATGTTTMQVYGTYLGIVGFSLRPVEYFGGVDIYGNPSGTNVNNDPDLLFTRAYTCPGSGPKTITVFQTDGHEQTHSGNVGCRLGIWNAAGTTLLFDSGQFNVPANGGVDQWCGPASLAGAPTLQGGTDYTLGWIAQASGGGVSSDHVDGTRSYGTYYVESGFYANGMPADLTALTVNSTYPMYPIRVGVTDAEASNVPTLLLIG